MVERMAVTDGDNRYISRTRRVVAALNRYTGWMCVAVLGIGLVIFFNARADLVNCSTDYADENNRVSQIRAEANLENTKAFADVIKSAEPLLDPNGHPTIEDQAAAFRAFQNFNTVYPQYLKTLSENPTPTYESFCGDTPRQESKR